MGEEADEENTNLILDLLLRFEETQKTTQDGFLFILFVLILCTSAWYQYKYYSIGVV